MTKPVILTGLRANNDLTIGNYFGAILPMIDMATTRSSEFQVNMFIPDLHSFTTPIDHEHLYDQILHNARLYTAAGLPLDNPDIHLYRQSYIPAHSELTWILDCFTGFGEMSRMTQFKDKGGSTISKSDAISLSNQITEQLKQLMLDSDTYNKIFSLIKNEIYSYGRTDKETSVGLFNYPVLMAADILLYGARYVPVGDDQTQHLEFARNIAERMNGRFGELFVVPEPVAKQHEFFGKDQGLRIMDLVRPTSKMSKSDDSGKGVIFLGDDPDDAAKKIMSATTDDLAKVSYDRANQPGISNLIDILALLRKAKRQTVIDEFDGMERYGDFKRVVADEMKVFLTDLQSRLASVDDGAIMAKLISSESSMREQANVTLLKVQQAVGLRPKGQQ